MGSIGAKRSKKSKSKRTTLKQKYKVLRKVKEHHRKKRKEMKKKGLKPREPKDPGIPNSWPFKQELIQELQVQHERDLAREAARKEEQRMRQVRAWGWGLGGGSSAAEAGVREGQAGGGGEAAALWPATHGQPLNASAPAAPRTGGSRGRPAPRRDGGVAAHRGRGQARGV